MYWWSRKQTLSKYFWISRHVKLCLSRTFCRLSWELGINWIYSKYERYQVYATKKAVNTGCRNVFDLLYTLTLKKSCPRPEISVPNCTELFMTGFCLESRSFRAFPSTRSTTLLINIILTLFSGRIPVPYRLHSAVSCYFAPSPSEWIERESRYELLLLSDAKVICFCDELVCFCDVISCSEVTNLLLS